MRLTCLRLAVVTSCLGAGCIGSLAQDDDPGSSLDDRPHITVIGTATSQLVPDTVSIGLGVSMEKPTAAEAWEATSAAARAVVDAAKAASVPPSDLATTRIDLSQQFDNVRQPDGTVKREAHGFRASTAFRIRSQNFDQIGSLTQTLIEKGANSFEGVSFSTAHPEAIKDRLRIEAMRDARHQAELLANAAGVKLGALLQVERPDRPGLAGSFARTTAAAPTGMPVAPGAQTLSAEVEATYAIE